MNYKIRHIFIFIFVFSVCSLTLQTSVIQLCTESKVFKNQNQQNPITEEEEKSHDSDESVDEEDLLYSNCDFYGEFHCSKSISFWNHLEDEISSSTLKILIPPPKFLI